MGFLVVEIFFTILFPFFLYLIYGCSDVEILMEIYLQASWTLVRFFDRMKWIIKNY